MDKYVFISQPMKNRPDAEIREERTKFITDPQVASRIAEELGSPSFKILESIQHIEERDKVKNLGVYYLGGSFKILAKCDLAVFMPGWERANGCVMEHHAAVLYGIPHVDF